MELTAVSAWLGRAEVQGMFQRACASYPSLLPACPTRVQAPTPVLSTCPFPQPSRVFSDPGLQGTEIDIFSYKPTLLTSKTLEKIRPVLDYRCMVSGSEQKFLLGLGVSAAGFLPSKDRDLPLGICTAACHSVHVLLVPRNLGFNSGKLVHETLLPFF